MMKKKCCCGCKPKTWTMISAVLNAIGGGAYLTTGIKEALGSYNIQVESKDMLTGVGEAEAVFSGIMVLVSICLFIGAQTGSPVLLLPWLVYTVIYLIANTVLNIIESVKDFDMEDPAKGAIKIAGVVVYILFDTFFWYTVFCLYRQKKGTGTSFTV